MNMIDLSLDQKVFKKEKVTILRNFKLTVTEGERLAIMGESGVGKTSLLNILGLIDLDFEGSYVLFGQPVQTYSLQEQARIRNQKIGFILQESSLIDSITMEENIKLPLLYADKKGDEEEYFQALVEKMGIQTILSKKPLQCSGGQRSRAAIARALMMKPTLILADEPTASLDEKNRGHVLDILETLNRDFNSTIITVTHDRAVADRHDRTIYLGGE